MGISRRRGHYYPNDLRCKATNSILSCGAIPVFADVEESTFNLSPSAVEDAITEKTKAILPVHLYGLPADMESLRSIAEVNDIALIGDAAQAHGAKLVKNGWHSW